MSLATASGFRAPRLADPGANPEPGFGATAGKAGGRQAKTRRRREYWVMASASGTRVRGPLGTAGLLLGVAMGGFLDGILLHQVLQWHHLLSAVDSPAVQDPRVQILADGLFHAFMYGLAVAGLVSLWKARQAFAATGGGRLLAAWLLIGFGAWHVLDAVLFHWVLGLHHIRMDSQPLLWDALFAGLGLGATLWGWRRLRATRGGDKGGTPGAAAALTVAVVAAATWAAWPPPAGTQALVLFAPGTSPGRAFDALAAVDARTMWVDRSGTLWAVQLEQPADAGALYARGALLVSRSGVALGCFSWSRPAAQPTTLRL